MITGTVKQNKSRGERLMIRNRMVAARFFYWSEIKRRRFDDCFAILENDEFFIDFQTIKLVISSQQLYFDELRVTVNVAAVLRKQFPSWNWN